MPVADVASVTQYSRDGPPRGMDCALMHMQEIRDDLGKFGVGQRSAGHAWVAVV